MIWLLLTAFAQDTGALMDVEPSETETSPVEDIAPTPPEATEDPAVVEESDPTEAPPEDSVEEQIPAEPVEEEAVDPHVQEHLEAIEHVQEVMEQAEQTTDTLDALIRAIEEKAEAEDDEGPEAAPEDESTQTPDSL